MNDRAARVAMLIGGAPLTAAVAINAAITADQLGADANRFAGLGGTIAFCGASVWIWRRYVSWNARNAACVAGMTLLVLAQVIVWKPLWSSADCVFKIMLPFAQTGLGGGAWWIGCVLLWWSGALFRHGQKAGMGGNKMSPDSVRLALGYALMPLLPAVFFFTWPVLADCISWKDEKAVWGAYQVGVLVAVTAWLAIWRRRVEWTPRTRICTLVLALLFLATPPFVLVSDNLQRQANRGTFLRVLIDSLSLLPLYGLAAWFTGTALLWRRRSPAVPTEVSVTPDLIESAIRCPKCGYSLIGLREVRCPECGWSATLDEVVRLSVADVLSAAGTGV